MAQSFDKSDDRLREYGFSIVLALCVPLLLFLLAAGLILPQTWWYSHEFRFTGVDVEEGSAITNTLLAYFFAQTDQLPEVPFLQLEKEHLRDVKRVVQNAVAGFAFLVLLTSALSLILGKSSRRKAWLLGSCLTIFCLLLLAVVPFDPAFVAFHQVFFPQGNWSFPSSSYMLQVYRLQFWQDAAFYWAIHVLLLTFAIFLFSMRYKKTLLASKT